MLAGGTDAYDFRADLRAVYQYYCHNHPKPDEEQYPLWSGLAADSKMTRDELAARMKDCTGVGLPKDQRSAAQQQNLDNILNVIRIPERTLVRSEEHTSELQSLMRISYAVFCLKKKTTQQTSTIRYKSPTSNKQQQ